MEAEVCVREDGKQPTVTSVATGTEGGEESGPELTSGEGWGTCLGPAHDAQGARMQRDHRGSREGEEDGWEVAPQSKEATSLGGASPERKMAGMLGMGQGLWCGRLSCCSRYLHPTLKCLVPVLAALHLGDSG